MPTIVVALTAQRFLSEPIRELLLKALNYPARLQKITSALLGGIDADYIAFATAVLIWWITTENRPYYIKEACILGFIKTWRQEALDRVRDQEREDVLNKLRADPEHAHAVL